MTKKFITFAKMTQNPNGTYKYMFVNNAGQKVVKKSSKRIYKYMLIGFSKAEKGAYRDGTDWFFIGMGNNAKSIVNSWKSLYSHCELKVINIEQE